jgi:BirA family biotin operon repressor/biotin-[acetyl-CoA-carboxylase] ligase
MGSGRPTLSRVERFERVGSTQAVVREWLAVGIPEVCLAVADEQSAGRGRLERRWEAGTGQALLVSAGFRPAALPPARGWRLPAIAALAMLEAAREAIGHRAPLALKWPNDIVSLRDGRVRKVGGVLADVLLDQAGVDAVVVGVGVNVDWPAERFPPRLAVGMSSLREEAGRAVDRDALLDAWVARLLPAYASLQAGRFDAGAWAAAQATTGAEVRMEAGDQSLDGIGLGVDLDSGAILVRPAGSDTPRAVLMGEVVRCRVGRLRGHL